MLHRMSADAPPSNPQLCGTVALPGWPNVVLQQFHKQRMTHKATSGLRMNRDKKQRQSMIGLSLGVLTSLSEELEMLLFPPTSSSLQLVLLSSPWRWHSSGGGSTFKQSYRCCQYPLSIRRILRFRMIDAFRRLLIVVGVKLAEKH